MRNTLSSTLPQRLGASALIATLIAAGCSGPETIATDFPEDLYQVAFNAGVAQRLANACPSVSYDAGQQETEFARVTALMEERGYTREQLVPLLNELPKERIKLETDAYLDSAGVEADKPETSCAAAQKEIADSTATGAYLKG